MSTAFYVVQPKTWTKIADTGVEVFHALRVPRMVGVEDGRVMLYGSRGPWAVRAAR